MENKPPYHHKRSSFYFSQETERRVAYRQDNKCACCGQNIIKLLQQEGIDWQAHHIIPVQTARLQVELDKWFKSEDNCVILCEECHIDEAHNRNYNGLVSVPDLKKGNSVFAHAYATNVKGYKAWAEAITQKWEEIAKKNGR